jgi:hypothetical protein
VHIIVRLFLQQNNTSMEKLDFAQLDDMALSCEQAENCTGGSGGGKITGTDIEGL